MSMSKQTRKRPQRSSSSSEERGDGSQPQVKRTHQDLLSYVLDAINEKFKEGIQPVVEDAIGKVIPILGTMTETQSYELRKLESTIKYHDEQMAKMRDELSALKCQSNQQLAENRELKEEIEELRRMNPEHAMPVERTPSRPLERCDSRSLQLHFRTQLSSPLYTGKQIEGVEGASIRIALIDANTKSVVESGPEASIKLDVVVLKGDFNKENTDWTRKDFERYQMQQREGKTPLLVGDLQVMLKRGVGKLGKLKFTDNSSWHKSKTFRIGLKVAPGCCEGIRIREAITEALRVKEHRGEPYEKQYPAKPDDEVWRLKNIAKDGAFHMKLKEKGVDFVEDFLREYVRDGKSLRNVLGGGMTKTKWNVLIDHAKSCVQSGKLYQCSYDEVMSHAVVFNIIGQLEGYTADGCFYSTDSLSHKWKKHLDEMVKKAYNNWDRVKEFNCSIYPMRNPQSGVSPVGAISGQQDYSDQSGGHLTSFDHLAPSEHTPGSTRMVVKGYNETEVDESLRNIQDGNPNVASQNPPTESINLPEVPLHQIMAPTEPFSTPLTFNGHSTSNLHLHKDQGPIENLCSTSPQVDHGNEAQMCDSDIESWIKFLRESPSPDILQMCRSRTAVVSWLRIKAVFKWGFFVRRKVTSKVLPIIEQLN